MSQAKRTKKVTTIYLTEEQKSRLDELTEKTDVPKSVWIRRGIDIAIELAEARWAAMEALQKAAP